jgi:hypothetical protein
MHSHRDLAMMFHFIDRSLRLSGYSLLAETEPWCKYLVYQSLGLQFALICICGFRHRSFISVVQVHVFFEVIHIGFILLQDSHEYRSLILVA